MMTLLKGRFTVSEVTTDMVELLSYPWQTVYTTNYDNALEIAAHDAHRRVEALNNTDDPATAKKGLPIIHLHGFVERWDIHNFRESCILGADSYMRLTHVKKWLNRFRDDVDQAQIVVFVGFNAADFHLNQAIYDLTGLREKAFFINRPTAEADPDVTAAQRRLGTPFFIGREGLVAEIRKLLAKEGPKEPHLASFRRYTAPDPAMDVPTAKQIENLFIYGEIEHSQLARDSLNGVSEYRVQRHVTQEILDAIDRGFRIVLIEGYPCDGKTLLTEDLAHRISGSRPVFRIRQAYETVLNEVAKILEYAPNAALIVENCFDLPAEKLASIARQFDGQDGVLILTSRAVAVDASPVGLESMEKLQSFRRSSVARLNDHEARALSDLADQIAGWRDFHSLDAASRLRFIQNTCQASLPHFLMRLLKSDYVTGRYREEISKLSLSPDEKEAIIIALYTSHIGESALVSFLSNVMELDYGAIIDLLNERLGNDAFRIVRRSGDVIQTVPSIGAENILKNLFSDKEIVDAISPLLIRLSEIWRDPIEQKVFSQMMRFSILSDVVTNKNEIDRFFEHNKQSEQIRRMPLFWLQWHMAKCSFGELSDAEKYLEQGYKEARDFERRTGNQFDRRQLDDRRAKFLMLRAEQSERTAVELFRDFYEACQLCDKIFRQDDPQYYPFETFAEVVRVFEKVGHCLLDDQRMTVQKWLENLDDYARRRIGVVGSGYQRDKAQRALNDAASRLNKGD